MAQRDSLIEAFETQREWCERMGSAMYASLLASAAADVADGGPTCDVVGTFQGDPTQLALPLRLLGGVHRLVLTGMASKLARFYPTVGGRPDETMSSEFIETMRLHRDTLVRDLDIAPQTNEIGRSAALLPGLSYAMDSGRSSVRQSGPVRLFEIGASSGLNLLLDHYRYELGTTRWGDSSSEAIIRTDWRGPEPSLVDSIDIVERRGCDIAPVDVTGDADRLRALSFVWADQTDRFDRMSAAIEIARRLRPVVDKADAADWVERSLADLQPGTHTILQHSIMWQYLSEETQQRITRALEDAGARSDAESPLSHVRFEPPPMHYMAKGHVLTVTTWPGGDERILAEGHAHGAWIEWFG